MQAGKQVAIIGAALDLGAGRRGVERGGRVGDPLRRAERAAARLGYDVLDWGDVETAVLEATEETDETARYLPEIKAACGRIARLVGLALECACCRSCSAATTGRAGDVPGGLPAPSASACSGSTPTAT